MLHPLCKDRCQNSLKLTVQHMTAIVRLLVMQHTDPISASVGLAKDTFLMPVQAAGSLYIRQTSGVHWSPHKGSVEASEQH